jgi:hypothetical protein
MGSARPATGPTQATRLEVPTNTAVAYVAILVNRGYVTRTPQQRGISYLSAKSASTS